MGEQLARHLEALEQRRQHSNGSARPGHPCGDRRRAPPATHDSLMKTSSDLGIVDVEARSKRKARQTWKGFPGISREIFINLDCKCCRLSHYGSYFMR